MHIHVIYIVPIRALPNVLYLGVIYYLCHSCKIVQILVYFIDVIKHLGPFGVWSEIRNKKHCIVYFKVYLTGK